MSSRSRQKYQPRDLTDDEDSDIDEFTDDSRSRSRRPASLHGDAMRNHRRHRNNSETLELDHHEAEVISRIQRMKEKSKFIRERRSGSLTNWPTTRDRDSGSLSPSDEEMGKISTKYRKSSLTSPTPHHKKKHHSASDSDIENEGSRRPKSSTSMKNSSIVNAVSKTPSKSIVESRSPSSVASPIRQEIIKDSAKSETKEKVSNPITCENRPLKVVQSSTSTLVTSPNEKDVKDEKKVQQVSKVEIEKVPTVNSDEQKNVKVSLVDWECQHCTFVNEAESKICTICCKTRFEVLENLPSTNEDDFDIKTISESIIRNENDDDDMKQKGKVRKISFLPGTKAH